MKNVLGVVTPVRVFETFQESLYKSEQELKNTRIVKSKNDTSCDVSKRMNDVIIRITMHLLILNIK